MFTTNKITRSRTLQFLGLGLVLLAFLPQLSWAQANWTLFLHEDFEDGVADGWNLGSGWSIEDDNGNYVLSGEGACWLRYSEGDYWKNYSFEAKIKLIQDNANLYFRHNPQGTYMINVGTNNLSLQKETNDGLPPHNLQNADISFDHESWHTIKIQCVDENIEVYADSLLAIDYTDSDPVLYGSIGLETFGHTHFDDLIVMGESPLPLGVRWQKTGGPYGGLGYDIRIDPTNPDILYVTDTFAGVLKSTDGGESWREMNNGITARTGASGDRIPIFCLTIDPSNPNILWAGILRIKGVYKSTDGGENWEMKTEGIITEGFSENAVLTFRDFAVDPTNSDIVFVSGEIEDTFDGETKSVGVIYKSTDGGNHWRKVLQAENLFRPIDIDPDNPNVVYAATGIFDRASPGLEGVFKSTDGGETWFKINNGIDDLVLGFLDRDPSNNKTLFAATGREPPWGEVKGTIYKTSDGGNSWTKVLSRDWPMTTVVIAPSDSSTVYAGGDGVIWRSKDSGQTWQNLGFNCPGYILGIPIGMAVDPRDPEIVYVNSYDGSVFKSTDGGKNWIRLNDFVDPQNTGEPGKDYQIRSIEISSSIPDIIYVGIINRTLVDDIYASGEGIADYGIFKSSDGGTNWQQINNEIPEGYRHIYDIAVHPTDQDIVYAAVRNSGIYKTTNGGDTWLEKNNGLTSLYISTITIDPNNPETIYAGTINGFGIFKSTNGGETWSPSNDGMSLVCPSSLLPIGGSVKGISLEKPKFFNAKGSYPEWLWSTVTDIVVDPSNSQIVYASDLMFGVYRSDDGGKTWMKINEGLSMREVSSLAISDDGKILYAGTHGGGVFRLVLGGNQAPQIRSTVPNAADTVAITQGDSLRFEVMAYDLNGDSLSYAWSLNGQLLEGATGSSYLLRTTDLVLGYHSLIAEVADADTSVSVTWNIDIIAPTIVDNEELSNIPKVFALMQNYPNPFNVETVIRYALPRSVRVRLIVYDVLGREVARLADQYQEAGYHVVRWNTKGIASGIYFYRLKAVRFSQIRKLIILK